MLALTKEQNTIYSYLKNTKDNLLIVGGAGVGKSAIVNKYIEDVSISKKLAILAPTGIAAINVNGVTMHRFLGITAEPPISFLEEFRDSKYIRKLKKFRELITVVDEIIIDEIGMLRADLLNLFFTQLAIICTKIGRQVPRIIMIGDPFQLPPIVIEKNNDIEFIQMSNDLTQELLINVGYKIPKKRGSEWRESGWFFDAVAFTAINPKVLALTSVIRQSDKQFVEILNNIRVGEITSKDLNILNKRVSKSPKDTLIMVGTNKKAELENTKKINKLEGEITEYKAEVRAELEKGRALKVSIADAPVEGILKLKKGVKVVLTVNDSSYNKMYVNGDKAEVRELGGEYIELLISRTGALIVLEKKDFIIENYLMEEGKLRKKKLGTITQFPIRVGYAITVHKSQGQTFESGHINVGKSFADGQYYVALSRVKSLEGLTLQAKLDKSSFKVSERVQKWYKSIYKEDEASKVIEEQIQSPEVVKSLKEETKQIKKVKTGAERQAALKKRREEQGLKKKSLYVSDNEFFAIKAFLKEQRAF